MEQVTHQEIRLQGSPICTGIAIGKSFVFNLPNDSVSEFSVNEEETEREISRYRHAVQRSKQEVMRLQKQLESEGALEGAAILDSHLQIIQDPLMTTRIEQQIRGIKKNAEHIFQIAIHEYQEKFNKIVDPFFRERFKDIEDVAQRIMSHLKENGRLSLADIPVHSIVFARELAPSDTAEAKSSRVGAFVTECGGETSHAAIMAKARGIPYVARVNLRGIEPEPGSHVIVDGRTGDIILNPTKTTLTKYRELQRQHKIHIRSLEKSGAFEAETIDGYRIHLSANIEMFEEIEMIHQYGGRGVGLFRSEYMCLAHETFPSEEEQFLIYRRIVEGMKGLPVVIRTFDVGGDKFKELQGDREELNPFLGCRAIRFMLKEKDIFRSQLRAILRASAYGQVKIMFPMVSGLPELLEAKRHVAEMREDLLKAGVKVGEEVKIGCMVEVPSAAITCDVLAKECDFLSIGTNDLVQYSLAVDRGNQAMSYLYNPTHPGVIRLIKMIVTEGNRTGIPVSVCGEIAADPRFTALLLGLGVHELSVASRYIPIVKNAIRMTSIVSASQLADKILNLSTAIDVQNILIHEYQQNVSSDSF